MSDPIDLAFQSLRGQLPPAPFAPADSVRRRGRQRGLRQATAAGIAVFVALTGGLGTAAMVVDRGSLPGKPAVSAPPATSHGTPATSPTVATPSGTPSQPQPTGPTATPDPTDLSSRLLGLADLGVGAWQAFRLYEPFQSADLWYWDGACPAYRSADYPSLRHIADVSTRGYRDRDRYVHQHVTRYAQRWGPHAIDDTRTVVSRCASGGPTKYTIVGTGFAGDASLLVRGETGTDTDLIAVVRVGDLLTLLVFAAQFDRTYAEGLAAQAAIRLRGP